MKSENAGMKREEMFFFSFSWLREFKIRSLVFELNIESHLLDPQLVSSWSKIFMTLPQRSGLESRGHSVTVGKTILSIGKVSTTDFIGFSCQPASLKSICSRCQTKCNVKSVLVQF